MAYISKVRLPNNTSYDINADTVDQLHLNNQAMAYIATLSIQIGCAGIAVKGSDTEANIFAKTGYMYGQLWYATDTQKYYRRSNTQTTASSANWRNDTTQVLASLALPNQATNNPIYIKIDTKQKYFSALPKFFVTAGYDNINGSTTVTGFCRQTNQFYIEACSYNGNNLKGVYQPSANTDIYYFKLSQFASTYGADSNYSPTITILSNFIGSGATITLINANHSEYPTVSSYSYVSIPTYGITSTSGAFDKINGVTVGSNPKFTDNNTTYSFAEGSTNGAFNVTPSGGTAQTVVIHGLGSMAYKSSLAAADIPALDASKITSGQFADARIASAATWNAKYTKPSGGIPASDLAEAYYLASNPSGFITTTEVDGRLQDIREVAEGKTKNYTTKLYSGKIYTGTTAITTPTTTLPSGATSHSIGATTDAISIDTHGTVYLYLYNEINGQLKFTSVAMSEIKQGDNLLIIDTDVPDYWFRVALGDTTLYKLETAKVDLDSFASISNGVVSIGGNTITPITDISGKQDKITSSNKLDYSLISNTPTIPTVPTNYVKTDSNTTLNDGVTTSWCQYGNRYITISGNAITLDMSQATGGWDGNFAAFKDPTGTTTSMLGFYGGTAGLTHFYMGGTYSDPHFKMTPGGIATFKNSLRVPSISNTTGTATYNFPTSGGTLALESDIPSITSTDVTITEVD